MSICFVANCVLFSAGRVNQVPSLLSSCPERLDGTNDLLKPKNIIPRPFVQDYFKTSLNRGTSFTRASAQPAVHRTLLLWATDTYSQHCRCSRHQLPSGPPPAVTTSSAPWALAAFLLTSRWLHLHFHTGLPCSLLQENQWDAQVPTCIANNARVFRGGIWSVSASPLFVSTIQWVII